MSQEESSPTAEELQVDIEAIMQEIRLKILTDQTVRLPDGEPLVAVGGKQLPPAFYEHLYHAGLAYNRVGVKMNVTKVNTPVIGPMAEWLRRKLHELVLYYVNQVAAQQVEVNYHLLRAVSILSQELEKEEETR
ncbi:MAG: hypothetical protein IPH82_11475 [Chloroflexi bacterium]|nr:hypothetical protein [Chloroflexota bacterium]MBK8930742.1 hypothetical protein [Chloroflexota bacterium]